MGWSVVVSDQSTDRPADPVSGRVPHAVARRGTPLSSGDPGDPVDRDDPCDPDGPCDPDDPGDPGDPR